MYFRREFINLISSLKRHKIITKNMTNKCVYKYLYLLYYKHGSLLHVSGTYSGHLQGGVP